MHNIYCSYKNTGRNMLPCVHSLHGNLCQLDPVTCGHGESIFRSVLISAFFFSIFCSQMVHPNPIYAAWSVRRRSPQHQRSQRTANRPKARKGTSQHNQGARSHVHQPHRALARHTSPISLSYPRGPDAEAGHQAHWEDLGLHYAGQCRRTDEGKKKGEVPTYLDPKSKVKHNT